MQWSDHYDRENLEGRISIARYATITFPQGTYEGLNLNPGADEDAIFYGEINEVITTVKGHRLSDVLEQYPRSGRIKSVNDNTNRPNLKNLKVVVG